MFMYVCMPESTLSFRVFEIDAIIFTFFFRVPNQALSLSLSLAHQASSLFFAAGKKNKCDKKKEHTRRTNTKDESRTRAVAARR